MLFQTKTTHPRRYFFSFLFFNYFRSWFLSILCLSLFKNTAVAPAVHCRFEPEGQRIMQFMDYFEFYLFLNNLTLTVFIFLSFNCQMSMKLIDDYCFVLLKVLSFCSHFLNILAKVISGIIPDGFFSSLTYFYCFSSLKHFYYLPLYLFVMNDQRDPQLSVYF